MVVVVDRHVVPGQLKLIRRLLANMCKYSSTGDGIENGHLENGNQSQD